LTPEYRLKFKLRVGKHLSAEAQQQTEKFVHWLRSKRYSESTIKTYTEATRIFLQFFSEKALSEIDNDDIVVFNNEYILQR